VKRRLCIGLVVAAVCGTAAACALAAVPAKVGTLRFSYPERFAHLNLGSAVIVADYPLSKDSPTVRTATFPANGVVFELEHEPKLGHPVPAARVRFPLSLDRLGRITRHSDGRTWELRFSVNGDANDVYLVVVWSGKTASARDRAAVASIVASVRAAHL
jgi:hypothetical protein